MFVQATLSRQISTAICNWNKRMEERCCSATQLNQVCQARYTRKNKSRLDISSVAAFSSNGSLISLPLWQRLIGFSLLHLPHYYKHSLKRQQLGLQLDSKREFFRVWIISTNLRCIISKRALQQQLNGY